MAVTVRRHLSTRLVLAAFVAVPVAVAVALLAVAVESTWDPFHALDQRAAARLHTQAVAHPAWTHAMALVSDLGGPTTFRVLVGVSPWCCGCAARAVWRCGRPRR